MRIKEGASIRGLSNEMGVAIGVTESIYQKHNSECVITEGTGGKHSIGSLHYVGLAIDVRTRMLNSSELAVINLELKEALGSEFDVVLESDHFHIEFQPKTQM